MSVFADEAAALAALKAVAVDVIVAERAGVLALARTTCAGVDVMIASGRMTSEAGGDLKRQLRGFADQVAVGLHIAGPDPDGVRTRLRAVVGGPRGENNHGDS